MTDSSATASPKVVAIVERQGAQWYAGKVVAPMLEYDFQGEVDIRERVQRHMDGFPEPLRSKCRAAVAALSPASDDPEQP